MTPRFVLKRSASIDIADATAWYALRSTSLAAEFVRAIDVALAEVRRTGTIPHGDGQGTSRLGPSLPVLGVLHVSRRHDNRYRVPPSSPQPETLAPAAVTANSVCS
jgi:hypothetical protein